MSAVLIAALAKAPHASARPASTGVTRIFANRSITAISAQGSDGSIVAPGARAPHQPMATAIAGTGLQLRDFHFAGASLLTLVSFFGGGLSVTAVLTRFAPRLVAAATSFAPSLTACPTALASRPTA